MNRPTRQPKPEILLSRHLLCKFPPLLTGQCGVDARHRGLGTGSSVATLIAQGVNTTVVEIDPKVHEYATMYFGLSPNHTSLTEDAVIFAERAIKMHLSYDYIIHDVFTGGAEPVDLFTVEFVRALYALLNPDGAIAIVSLQPPIFTVICVGSRLLYCC